MKTPGLETIRGLVGEPPKTIKIIRKLMHTQQLLMQGWNALHIAIIPYCYKCKEPLTWHNPPDNEVLFNCPKCGREWIKEEGW